MPENGVIFYVAYKGIKIPVKHLIDIFLLSKYRFGVEQF
jgi:hypothetical protein